MRSMHHFIHACTSIFFKLYALYCHPDSYAIINVINSESVCINWIYHGIALLDAIERL
jgi:hypothetical protein